MIRRNVVYLTALCAVLIPMSAAILTTYTNSGLFTSALSSQNLIDFNSLPGNGDYSNSVGLTTMGVNFVSSDQNLSVFPSADWGSGPYLLLPYFFGATSYLTITLPANTNAAGFDLGTKVNAGTFTVTIAGQAFTVGTALFPGRTFFGVTSDTSLTTIQIALNAAGPSGPRPLLDNFIFGTATVTTPPADTPEVATFVLIGSGLMMMRYGGRRLQTTASA